MSRDYGGGGRLTDNDTIMATEGKEHGKNPIVAMWVSYLRLSSGGIISIPFPAQDLDDANELADLAAKYFDGVVLDVVRED